MLIERRHEDPLVPLRIFSNRSLAAADVTMLVVGGGAVRDVLLLHALSAAGARLQRAEDRASPTCRSASRLIGGSAAASRLVDRFTPKPVLVTGLLVATAGFVLLTRVSGHSDYASHVLPAIIVLGVGLGLSFVPITIAATNGVAAAESGLASGLLNTTQQVGGSLGLAILSSVSTSRVTSALDAGSPLPAALTHGFKGAFVVGGRDLRAWRSWWRSRCLPPPPARAREGGRRDDRAVVRPLPRRAVLWPPRSPRRVRSANPGAPR